LCAFFSLSHFVVAEQPKRGVASNPAFDKRRRMRRSSPRSLAKKRAVPPEEKRRFLANAEDGGT